MPARPKNRMLLVKLTALAAAMFVFAIFVLPPLYDLFCEITGIGGKTDGAYTAVCCDKQRNHALGFLPYRRAGNRSPR
jgi:cytochrome c oxidase assembly protein Cox11